MKLKNIFAAGLVAVVPTAALAGPAINGAGASFPAPIYQRWFAGSAALNGIKLDENLAGENPNPSGATAYPISTLTWILAYKTGNGSNASAIREALNYALSSKAQSLADDLGYVPLSGSILNRARLAVGRIGN